jgi:hypothetical protein
VQESFDEPRMFAAAAEQYDIQEGYRPTAAYAAPPMAHYDQATGRWNWSAFQCRNPACKLQTGKALLFAYEIPGVTLGDNGFPVFLRVSKIIDTPSFEINDGMPSRTGK